jgi:hypothetical protein
LPVRVARMLHVVPRERSPHGEVRPSTGFGSPKPVGHDRPLMAAPD